MLGAFKGFLDFPSSSLRATRSYCARTWHWSVLDSPLLASPHSQQGVRGPSKASPAWPAPLISFCKAIARYEDRRADNAAISAAAIAAVTPESCRGGRAPGTGPRRRRAHASPCPAHIHQPTHSAHTRALWVNTAGFNMSASKRWLNASKYGRGQEMTGLICSKI